jgi:hypothetical protein
VFDNCEHVIEAAASVAERLLRGPPAIRMLATSREPLRAEGEHSSPTYALASRTALHERCPGYCLGRLLREGLVEAQVLRTMSQTCPLSRLANGRGFKGESKKSQPDRLYAAADYLSPMVAHLCGALPGLPLHKR